MTPETPSDIPPKTCSYCKELIGDRPFMLDPALAVDGAPATVHRRCFKTRHGSETCPHCGEPLGDSFTWDPIQQRYEHHICPKRPAGRPRLYDETVRVNATLPARLKGRLVAYAASQDTSASIVVTAALSLYLGLYEPETAPDGTQWLDAVFEPGGPPEDAPAWVRELARLIGPW